MTCTFKNREVLVRHKGRPNRGEDDGHVQRAAPTMRLRLHEGSMSPDPWPPAPGNKESRAAHRFGLLS